MISFGEQVTGQDDVLEDVIVVVRDQQGWRQGCVHEDIALTLYATVSDDPRDWEAMKSHWSRYKTETVPESVEGLLSEQAAASPSLAALREAAGWVAIDLVECRVLTGSEFQEVKREAVYDMLDPDGTKKPGRPLPVCLPPWWELQQDVDPDRVHASRDEPLRRAVSKRSILFGDAIWKYFAQRLNEAACSDEWRRERPGDAADCYDWIVKLHRDWLMTPRADLDGDAPRDHVVGGVKWLESLCHVRRIRIQELKHESASEAPPWLKDDGPMGLEEVCIYFEYCRILLAAGFRSLCAAPAKNPPTVKTLQHLLKKTGGDWLETVDEDGLTPLQVIEVSRRHCPLSDAPIHGMEGESVSISHSAHCGCAICDSLDEYAKRTGAVSFTYYDGYMLEMDEEFAFSLWPTMDDWKLERSWLVSPE